MFSMSSDSRLKSSRISCCLFDNAIMTSIHEAMVKGTGISIDSKSLGNLLIQQSAQLHNAEFMDNCAGVDDTGTAAEKMTVKRDRQ